MWTIREEGVEAFYAAFAPYTEILLKYDEEYANAKSDSDALEICDKIEDILDHIFSYTIYTLGAEFESRTILKWLDAYQDMKAVFARGDELYLIASY